MATSLARQLKKLETPQTSKLVQRRGRFSFLYDYLEAAAIDCNTHYALAISSLDHLIALDPSISRYKRTLFDPSSKSFDRGLKSTEENDQIDEEVKKFLYHVVAPYFLLSDTHKVLEWLIYKFDVNLYNTDSLILCTMPYHHTRLFPRLLQAIPEFKEESNKWHFLRSAQKNGTPVLKSVIINRCLQEDWLRSLMIESLPDVISCNPKNGIFVSLITSVLLGCVTRSQEEELLSSAIEFIVTGLSSNSLYLVTASYTVLATLSSKCQISPQVLQSIFKKASRKFNKYPFRQEIKNEFGLMTATVIGNQSSSIMKQVTIPSNALQAVMELDLPADCWSKKVRLVHHLTQLLIANASPETMLQLLKFLSSLPKGALDSKLASSIAKRIHLHNDSGEAQCHLLKLILVLGDASAKSRVSLMRRLEEMHEITLDASAAVSLIDELTIVQKDDPSALEQRIQFDLNSSEWRHVMILLELFAAAVSFESPTCLLLLAEQLLRESLITNVSCEYYRCLIIKTMTKCVQLDADLGNLEVDSVIESLKSFKKPQGFKVALSFLTMVGEKKRGQIIANINILLVNLAGQPELLEQAISCLIPRLVGSQSAKTSPSKSRRTSGLDAAAEHLVDAFVDSIFEVAPHKRVYMLQLLLKQLPARCVDYACGVLESEKTNNRLSKLGEAGEQMLKGRRQLAQALKSK